MFWLPGDLADALRDILAREADTLALEGAVHGLDSRSELEIQKLLADGLAESYSVAREVHYPSSRDRRRTHRKRCDLVLTQFDRPLALLDSEHVVDPSDALWLEVKVAHQFREGSLRNARYREQWRTGIVDDLRKIGRDPRITDAAFVLVVFTEGEALLEKDLASFEDWLVTHGVEVGFRKVRSFAITERRGHTLCSVAVWPTVSASCGRAPVA